MKTVRLFVGVMLTLVIGVVGGGYLFAQSEETGTVKKKTSIHTLGLCSPISHWSFDLSESSYDDEEGAQKWRTYVGHDSVPITRVGVNLFYNHMKLRNSGYVSLVQVEMGYANAWCSDLDQFYDSNMQGFNTKAMWGWGYAPIRRKDFILTVHGMLGLELFYLADTVPDSITHGEYETNVFMTIPFINCLIGANVQAIYRIQDHFSVAAGLTIYTGMNFGGAGLIVPEGASYYQVDADGIGFGGITVEPRISACWVYD